MADYAIRYQEYVEELCENKEKPALACKGTCQIAKLLKKEAPQEAPSLPSFTFTEDWINLQAIAYSDPIPLPLNLEIPAYLKVWGQDLICDLSTPPPKILA